MKTATAKKKLDWTPEHTEQFERIKDMVDNRPKLHFIDPEGEVIVCTDASEYGVGAYISQIVDGQEQPVAFMSKALSATEQRWTTIEQEAYGCYFGILTFETKLRGKRFTLETDHRNLIWMEKSVVPKIIRWVLYMKSFDFQVRHVAGRLNNVADHLSRYFLHHLTDSLLSLYPSLPLHSLADTSVYLHCMSLSSPLFNDE
jgi:phospholipid-translocating ATPase